MQDHTVGKYLLAKQPPAQAIVLDATRTVGDAAALLLRHKVEAVIITNKAGNAVGVVTRKGIFQTGGSEDDGFDVFQ